MSAQATPKELASRGPGKVTRPRVSTCKGPDQLCPRCVLTCSKGGCGCALTPKASGEVQAEFQSARRRR
jgi:hypothetical protein